MKLHRIELGRIRHFAARTIELDPRAPTLLVGLNEAGKSTFLEAIRRLLFGFAVQSPHLVDGFEQRELSVGAHVSFDDHPDRVYELHRRKGKGETLDGRAMLGGDAVSEGWLLDRMGRPREAMFERVFAFSLEELTKGADALKDTAVGASLSRVALGTAVAPDKVVGQLKKDADELFKPGGTLPRLNKLARAIEEQEQVVRRASTDPSEWRARREAFESKTRAVEKANVELAGLRRALDRARAFRQGLEGARAMASAQEELASIEPPRDASRETAESHRRAHDVRARAHDELARAREELASIDREIDEEQEASSGEEALLRAAPRIDRAYRALDGYETACTAAPRLEAEADVQLRAIAGRLVEARAGWSLDALREVRIDVAASESLEVAIAERAKLRNERTLVEREVDELTRASAEIEARLAELPLPEDATAARAWLAEWAAHVEARKKLDELDRTLRAGDRVHAQRVARLDPPLPERAADRPYPREGELAAFAEELAGLEKAASRAADQRTDREVALAECERALAALVSQGSAPTESQLADARARREEGWRLVRRALAGEPDTQGARAFDAERPLPRAYEQAVLRADALVDDMRRRADAVQRRSQEEARKLRAEQELAQLDRSIEELASARRAWSARWSARWQKAGVEPRSPIDMRAWLRDVDAILEEEEAAERRRAERVAIASGTDSYVAWGRALLGVSDGAAAEVHARILAHVGAQDARGKAVSQACDHRDRDGKTLAKKRDGLAALVVQESAAEARFAEAARVLGVEGESPEAARKVVTVLASLRRELAAAESTRARAIERSAEVVAFEESLAALRAEIGPFTDVTEAHARLDVARRAQSRRQERARRHGSIAHRIASTDAELRRTDDAIAEIHARFGVEDAASFARVVERSERAAELACEIDDRRRALRDAKGPFPSLDAFLLALSDVSAESLDAELAEIERAITAVDEDRLRDKGKEGEAKLLLERIDGGAAAAEASNDLESKRSELREELERWLAIELARTTLERSIERFEADHRAPLLAAASSLFATMTAGRYAAIKARIDGTLLVERAEDHATRTPDQLSTGTREQLFLALRLACVDAYVDERNESLPIILDDVLVDFDPPRTRATLEALVEVAKRTQVVLLTCHPHLADLAKGLPITRRDL